MKATLKLSMERFAEMLRTHHEATKNGNKNDRSVIREPEKFVELFRDFWIELKADAFLSGEVERLSDEHLRRMAENQQRRGTAGSIPSFEQLLVSARVQNQQRRGTTDLMPCIDITREAGCLFLRLTAGVYDDQEADDFRQCCHEWIADPLMSDADRQWAIDHAEETTERRSLEDAVWAACFRRIDFPCKFESMLAALEWLVAVDVDRQKTETPPGAPKGEGTPVDDRQPVVEVKPKVYLSGWPDILDAVGRKNSQTEKNSVLGLNERFDGPIPKVGKGSKPLVEKSTLLNWWNGLEDRFREIDASQKNKAATVAEQYQYGRDATVFPGIGGHEKKSQSKKG